MSCCVENELMHCTNSAFVPPFIAFTAFTPVLPENYWNIESEEQRYLALCKQIDKIICYSNYMGQKVTITKELIDDLYDQFEQFRESGFEDYYYEQINSWIEAHMPEIVSTAMRMVFFGLTDDGYFCAYIPDSWSDITFDTGMQYGTENYGRLILKMNVDDTFQYHGFPNSDH